MSVSSPGGLVESYTIEDLRLGVSALRNPNLAAIMYRLGYIESYGTGIPRLIKAYEGKTEPVLKSTQSVFFVELPSLLGKDMIPIEDDGTDTYVTRSDLEAKGMSRNEAIKRLNSMIADGRIVKEGGGRSTRYRIL